MFDFMNVKPNDGSMLKNLNE